MAFKQSLPVEVVVKGGLIAAFQRNFLQEASKLALEYSRYTIDGFCDKKLCVIYMDNPDANGNEDDISKVEIKYFFDGLERANITEANYEEAWITAQRLLR